MTKLDKEIQEGLYDPKRTLVISKGKPVYFKEKGQKAKEWGKELRAKAHEGKKLKGQQRLTSAVSTSRRLSEFAFPEETVYDISSDNPRIRDAMDKMLDIFKNGRFDVVARAIFQRGKGARPSDLWSFSNRMLMYIMGTDDARGYKQWQEIGRYVKKGAKAIYILAPLTKKAYKTVKVIDPGTGTEQEEKQSYYYIYGFRAVPVFRVEDTEGAPVIEDVIKFDIPYELTGIVNELGLDVKAIPFSSGSYGYYAPSSKRIRLSSPDIEVFLHEMSHAVDDKLHGLKGGQRTDQEVIAEFSAAVIGHMMGFEMKIGTMIDYVASYSFTELLKQLNRVEKVVNFVIERTTAVSGLPMVIGQTLPMQVYDIKGIADSLKRQGIEPDLVDIEAEYDHNLSHSENLKHIKQLLGLGGRRKQSEYEAMAEEFYKAQTMGSRQGWLAHASPQERAAAFARMREQGTLRGYDLKQVHGGFEVKIPYSKRFLTAVKSMKGSRWNPESKSWFVPFEWEGELIILMRDLGYGREKRSTRYYDPKKAEIYIITDSKGNKHRATYAQWLKWMKEQKRHYDPNPLILPPTRWYEAMVKGIRNSSDVRNPYAIVKNIWARLSPSKRAQIKRREAKGEQFKYDLPLPDDKPTMGIGTLRMVKPFKLAEVQINLRVKDYLSALKSGIFSKMKRQDGTTALVARCKSPVKNVNIFVDKGTQ